MLVEHEGKYCFPKRSLNNAIEDEPEFNDILQI